MENKIIRSGKLSAIWTLSMLTAAPLFFPQVAHAQDQAQASGQMEEIVVTATKRSEDTKAIPMSISAVTGSQLEAARIVDYDDIARAIPGVTFNSGGSEGQTYIAIRGVSSTVGSSAVGVYIDDVSITIKNFFDGTTQPKLFDLDRLEVLRGPQGTLWGASSEGGVLRFVTKQPNMEDFSGYASADVSGTDHTSSPNTEEQFAINIPIVPDKIALRASFGFTYNAGYIDNYNHVGSPDIRSTAGGLAKSGVNWDRAEMGRINATIVVDDELTLKPSIFYQNVREGDSSIFYPAVGLWQQDKQVDEYNRDSVFLPSVTATYDLGFAELTSVSGYFLRQVSRVQDGTFYDSTIFAEAFVDSVYPAQAPLTDSIIGNIPSPVTFHTNYGQVSEEIRLASKPESDLPLKWLVGVYYADQWDHHQNLQIMPGVNADFQKIFGIPMEQSLVESVFGAPGLTLFPNDYDILEVDSYDERQIAGFGQADFDITPKLHGSIGGRYAMARAVLNYNNGGFYNTGNPVPYNRLDHFYSFTPKFTVSYEISPESNIYASASEGSRFGGEGNPIPFGPNSVCAQDDVNFGVTSRPGKFYNDKLWSYEVGTKNRLDGNRLSIDAAAYYIDWQNLQQQIFLPICGFPFTSNVGNAEVYGGELSARYSPIAGLVLGLTGNVDQATVVSTTNSQTVAVGEDLIDVPKWTMSLMAEYSLPINDEMTLITRADFTESGHSHGTYQVDNSNFENPAYGVLNASVGITTDLYDLSLYAKNLANDRTIIQRPEINAVISGYTVRPLTVGVTGKVRF